MPDIYCLAFSPHPDDAELFCGGLLLKLKKQGCTTAVIDLTLGELSTNGDTDLRARESQEASQILQLDVRENLRMEDGNIEDSRDNRNKIISIIRTLKPHVCLVPFRRDRHPDHEAASQLVKNALFYAGLTKIKTGQDAYRPAFVIYYMLHHIFEPSFVVDISDEMDKKMAAIMAYKSQFITDHNASETYINKTGFIESIKSRAEFFGHRTGVSFAEPYYYEGIIKIDNIRDYFA